MMKVIKILSGMFIALLFSNCSYEFACGTYSMKKSPHYLVIHADSTFDYKYGGGCYKSSSGTWTQDNKFIYLNSNCTIEHMPSNYQKSKGDSVDSKGDRLSVISVNVDAPLIYHKEYICVPFVNGELAFEFPDRGAYSFCSKIPIDSIFFLVAKLPLIMERGVGIRGCFNDVNTEMIKPNLAVGDDLNITVHIIDSLFSYQVFLNKKIKKKHGRLLFEDDRRRYKLKHKDFIDY